MSELLERMKLPEGAVRATCYIERHPSGLWFFYSDELRGLLLTHRDLGTLLGAIPEAGKELLRCMEDWHTKTPYTGEDQLKQMQIYKDFFGDTSSLRQGHQP